MEQAHALNRVGFCTANDDLKNKLKTNFLTFR